MILENIADYLTELLSYDPEKILIGRENATQKTFEDNYIVIDSLSPANIITSNRGYDYNTEKETFNTLFKGSFTFEFYGLEAESNIYKFINLQNSQLARDLQKKYNITIFKDTTINNLKQLIGKNYFNRYEAQVMIQFYESNVIDTYRIESIDITEYLKK